MKNWKPSRRSKPRNQILRNTKGPTEMGPFVWSDLFETEGTGENNPLLSPVPKETSMRIWIRRDSVRLGDKKIVSWR